MGKREIVKNPEGRPTKYKQKEELTPKQSEWLLEYFKTGNATRSALKAYDTENYKSASVIASENLEKLRNPVRDFMEANGLSLGKLIEVLKDGLEANKVISAQVINQAGDGMKQANSMTKDFIDVPDHSTRHKYLETAAKWLGIENEGGTTAIRAKGKEMTIEFIHNES